MALFVIRQLKAAAHWGSGQENGEKRKCLGGTGNELIVIAVREEKGRETIYGLVA